MPKLSSFSLTRVVNTTSCTAIFSAQVSLNVCHAPIPLSRTTSLNTSTVTSLRPGFALLAHSSLPLRYWNEAFLTACYLINRMPTPVLQKHTPVHRLFRVQPNYDFLRTFGYACWPRLRKYNTHKIVFQSKQCVFLGHNPMHKGYKCLDKSTQRIYISRDVMFDESVFPYFDRPSLFHPLNRLCMTKFVHMTYPNYSLNRKCLAMLFLCRSLSPKFLR
jgi:hypothetical protein